jgi:hypothetical protein
MHSHFLTHLLWYLNTFLYLAAWKLTSAGLHHICTGLTGGHSACGIFDQLYRGAPGFFSY